MNAIEKLISAKGNPLLVYTNEQWISIVKYLLKSLEKFLNISLFIDHKIENDVSEGFSIDIRSKNILSTPLNIQCKGILGCDVLDDPQYLHISVILFLYSQNKKLITKSDDSYLYFIYKISDDGNGVWECDGWKQDVYYEYEFFDKF